MEKHEISAAVFNLYQAVKNARGAVLAGFSISPDSGGGVNALFVEPGVQAASHEFRLEVGGDGYELRFGDASLLCASIRPWEDKPVHIFGTAVIDHRQKAELIFTVALSVVHDLMSKTLGMWASRAKLLCTHINVVLRALRVDTERRQLPAEVAREVVNDSNEIPWAELARKVEEMRSESEHTGMPVFGPVQDSSYRLSAPANRTPEECASMLEQVRKLKDSCDSITVKSREGWPDGKAYTLRGRESTGFKKDTFYDITNLLTERGRMMEYDPPLTLEVLRQRLFGGSDIPESSVNDTAHALKSGLYAKTASDRYGSEPRYNARLRHRDTVKSVIGGSTYDWFRVNTGPDSVTRVAQLVEIDEFTLTFEFRDSLEGKRTTSKISFNSYSAMKDALQRIVGDPFRTENSVFTKRFGVDLPYAND